MTDNSGYGQGGRSYNYCNDSWFWILVHRSQVGDRSCNIRLVLKFLHRDRSLQILQKTDTAHKGASLYVLHTSSLEWLAATCHHTLEDFFLYYGDEAPCFDKCPVCESDLDGRTEFKWILLPPAGACKMECIIGRQLQVVLILFIFFNSYRKSG